MNISFIGYEANIKNRVGSNQYAFELMKALYKLDQKNQYTVFLPTPPLPDLPPERDNWQYQIVGPRKFWNFFGLPFALRRQRPKPNVIFNPGHYSPLFSFAPLAISIMDLGYLHYPEQFTKPILFKLKFWTSFSIKRAAHIFAISESTKNDIIKTYKIAENKITVTYPGFDREKSKIKNQSLKVKEIKKKYAINGDYILFLSTLKPSKNIEGLLEAFSRLTGMIPVKLVIAGKKGWLYETIFAKVKKLRLEDRVVFTDYVPEDDVSGLMAGAKVFVLPSFWEGFGIPVVEAMACGVPVVVSNAGSLPEIVGDAGVIVDPYKPDEIARGIEKAVKNRVQLIKLGLEQVKKFSWEDCAQKTLKKLEEVGK